MADQRGGDAAPQGMETKNMPAEFHSDPNVVRPAPVPYGDSTHIDREAPAAEQSDGDQGAQASGKAEGSGSGSSSRRSSSKS